MPRVGQNLDLRTIKPQPYGDFGRVFSASTQVPSLSLSFDFHEQLGREQQSIPGGMEAMVDMGAMHERAEHDRIARAVETAQHETRARKGGSGYSDIEDFEVQCN